MIRELLCFGVHAGTGNAALVVQHDASSAEQRQQFARERQQPACVFIDRPPAAAGDTAADTTPLLDFYYPHARSPLCLHATLAAARVLLSEQRPQLAVRTAWRGQPLTLRLTADGVFVALTAQAPPAAAVAALAALGPAGSAALAARLLAAPAIVLASAPALASVGSPKLLLEVADGATLRALSPDLAAISAWGAAHGINGCYAWCRRPDGELEGRNFNHPTPSMEDSATGVAAGALTLHLGQAIRLHQGAASGQPCLLQTSLDGEHILIGGRTEWVR